jgi:hypothetical protein
MTLLQIVNNILRRMREDEVADAFQTKYSTMVVDFINDAKTLVEDAWDWSSLRREVTVTTSDNVSDYLVSDTSQQSKLFYFVNDNSRQYMEYRPTAWIEQQRVSSSLKGMPTYFTYYNADGELRVRLWPTPDAAYTLRYYAKFPQAFLNNSNDIIKVPYMPVQHIALALLARERGETGGTSVAEYFAVADKFLSDAIAYDAANHPEDTIFRVV